MYTYYYYVYQFNVIDTFNMFDVFIIDVLNDTKWRKEKN